jgi:hypothetical protein
LKDFCFGEFDSGGGAVELRSQFLKARHWKALQPHQKETGADSADSPGKWEVQWADARDTEAAIPAKLAAEVLV